MRRNFACIALVCVSLDMPAQLNESFSDGNFTVNPVWEGSTGHWQVVAGSDVSTGAPGSNTLRLNAPSGGSAYLSTQVAGSWGLSQSWGFFVGRRGQAYTASNYTLIWLWANEPTRTSPTIDGYSIRIGDDTGDDDIVLMRWTNGSPTDILAGPALPNNLTDIGFLLRITRNSAGVWEMFTSPLPAANGTGAVATDLPNATNANLSHGSVVDNTYTVFDNGYIGFMNSYTSGVASRAAQEFDQVTLLFADAPLPVQLERFYADEQEVTAVLKWSVSAESGTKQYEVWQSGNGIHFTLAGTVPASGKQDYYFTCAPAAAQFYRLRIVDADGRYRFSSIIGVRGKQRHDLKAWPVPARQLVHVAHPKAGANGGIQLFSAEGVLVRQLDVPAGAVITRIDVAALPPGRYYIIFRNGTVLTASLVKL